MKLGCILMAAGQSRRFGTNKLLADFRGKPLCQWVMERARNVFEDCRIVTSCDAVAALAEGWTVIHNDAPEQGISRTIRLGLEAADWDAAIFLTADQPLLSEETLRTMKAAYLADPTKIHAASHRGKRGNPVIFPSAYFEALRALTGDTGGSRIIKQNPQALRLVEVPPEALLDCDTPEALQRLTDLHAPSCPLVRGLSAEG